MSEERIKKLEEQFTQMGDKLLKLEEALKKNGDPDTRARIDALIAEMDKMRKRLEAAGGTPASTATAAVAAAAAAVGETKTAAVKKDKSFEQDLGLE